MSIEHIADSPMRFTVWHRQHMSEVSMHVHRVMEMVVLKRGTASYTVNFVDYELHPGDVLLIFPNQPHSHSASCEDYEDYVFVFSPEIPLFGEVLANYVPLCPLLKGVADESIYELLDSGIERISNAEKRYVSLGIAQGYISIALGTFLPMIELRDKKTLSGTEKNDIIGYCVEHFAEPLTLSKVANALGYSANYFSYMFSKEYGISFVQFLNRIRVEEAKGRILQGYSFTDVALNCGFASIRNFNRVFKKINGRTPGQYKKFCLERYK